MAAKRKAISKKTRFEVFKRDGFACIYCGAHPPAVLLHVDHITAVANGGTNSPDNLVTACEPCNLGKGATPLEAIPESLAAKAIRVAEMEEQVLGYQSVMEGRRQRIEREAWRIAEVLEPGCSKAGISRDWLTSIRNFIEKLGLFDVLDAADIAVSRKGRPGSSRFSYFCGICWNKVKAQN